MSTDQGPVVQSALLRAELIRLRKDSGLTQEQVAQNLDWSPSKLIGIEGGRSSVTKVDLDALLTQYGITSESHRERLQALNRGSRERAWWTAYKDGTNPTYFEYVGYEAGASFIRQFQSGAVPGLLQTPAYAEALTSNSVDAVRVKAVKFRISARRNWPSAHPSRACTSSWMRQSSGDTSESARMRALCRLSSGISPGGPSATSR